MPAQLERIRRLTYDRVEPVAARIGNRDSVQHRSLRFTTITFLAVHDVARWAEAITDFPSAGITIAVFSCRATRATLRRLCVDSRLVQRSKDKAAHRGGFSVSCRPKAASARVLENERLLARRAGRPSERKRTA